jgi:hypothetical protein
VREADDAPRHTWTLAGGGFADGVNSPNGDASISSHAQHVLDLDPGLNELATLPPGFNADREAPDVPWVITPFEYGDD